jgi:hypothetical protein
LVQGKRNSILLLIIVDLKRYQIFSNDYEITTPEALDSTKHEKRGSPCDGTENFGTIGGGS